MLYICTVEQCYQTKFQSPTAHLLFESYYCVNWYLNPMIHYCGCGYHRAECIICIIIWYYNRSISTSLHAAAHPPEAVLDYLNSNVSTEAKTYDFVYTRKWSVIETFFNTNDRFVIIIIICNTHRGDRIKPRREYTLRAVQ